MSKKSVVIDDREYPPSWCDKCKHFDQESLVFCAAFPCVKGGRMIPRQFNFQGIKHDKPYPGDHGIMFEPIEKP